MRPWTVDADDIKIAEDFDDGLLHKPPWLEGFLTAGGDEKFIVVGTKGFGKTLLLKAKRIRYQATDGVLCIPENALLDKPIGDKIFSKDMLEIYAHSTEWWAKVWLISIAAAVLKRFDAARRPARHAAARRAARRPRLQRRHRPLRQPARPAAPRAAPLRDRCRTTCWCRACARSTRRSRSSSTTSTSTSTSTSAARSAARATPARSRPSIWYFAQMGLVEVAYQLRRVNHHLKVFAAVRKEAFLKFDEMTSMVQQYRGSAIDIHYTAREPARDLRQQHPPREGAQPRRSRSCCAPTRSRHSSASAPCAEPVHARGRGRLRLHRAPHAAPAARFHDHRPEAVRPAPAASAGVRDRFQEVVEPGGHRDRLRVSERDRAVSRQRRHAARAGALPSNVLTRARRSRTSSSSTTPPSVAADEMAHIFCMLFRAGLLGHLEHRSRHRQTRTALPAARRGDLPTRRHPADLDALSRAPGAGRPDRAAQPAATCRRIDRVNIIGNGAPVAGCNRSAAQGRSWCCAPTSTASVSSCSAASIIGGARCAAARRRSLRRRLPARVGRRAATR